MKAEMAEAVAREMWEAGEWLGSARRSAPWEKLHAETRAGLVACVLAVAQRSERLRAEAERAYMAKPRRVVVAAADEGKKAGKIIVGVANGTPDVLLMAGQGN